MSPGSVEEGHVVLLDACFLINLFATGRVQWILQSLPYRFAVARYVAEEEVLQIGGEKSDAQAMHPESSTSLRPLIEDLVTAGNLDKLDISSARERSDLVRFARELDDGEAHTCALALDRGALVATDDRKAIRVFRAAWRERHRSRSSTDPILRTSELLFPWAEQQELSDGALAEVLRSVASRASFLPPRDDPNFQRWIELLQTES